MEGKTKYDRPHKEWAGEEQVSTHSNRICIMQFLKFLPTISAKTTRIMDQRCNRSVLLGLIGIKHLTQFFNS